MKRHIIIILLLFFVLNPQIYGSVNSAKIQAKLYDQSLLLPNWQDGEYHDYYKTYEKIVDYNDNYSNLVSIFPIGESVLGKTIWCIRITNEQNTSHKYSCLIEGCIHGSEWEAGELCLYLSEYLLINFGKNSSVTDILNATNIYIVPIVNPDGRQKDVRCNVNCIDIDANFDIDFGRLRGHTIPLGKILGFIKIPYVRLPFFGICSNCGRRPWSEPETRAIRDLMNNLKTKEFSFLVDCHTACHCIISPWMIYDKPFKITQREKKVFDFSKNWIENNTEYENYVGNIYCSGNVMDWCFKELHVPSYTFELMNPDYEPGHSHGRHDNLTHWMKTGLPVLLYMLVNAENLHNWDIPYIEPCLPEGVPPPPLKYS